MEQYDIILLKHVTDALVRKEGGLQNLGDSNDPSGCLWQTSVMIVIGSHTATPNGYAIWHTTTAQHS